MFHFNESNHARNMEYGKKALGNMLALRNNINPKYSYTAVHMILNYDKKTAIQLLDC